MKLFTNLILLALSILLSGCETLKKMDEGLYAISDELSEKDRITGLRTLSFQDREAQIKAANQFSTELLRDWNSRDVKLNEEYDPVMYKRLKRIFKKVHSISHLRDEEWTVVLVGEEVFNAFVIGGIQAFFYSGLVEHVNDDELAAVIGHEIGHVVANHAFERRTHAIVSSLSNSKSVHRDSFAAAFTHEGEREADRIGILYCSLAGFDPYAASRLWKRMYEETGDRWTGRVHDHPVNSQRAEEAEETATKVAEYYKQGTVNPNYEDFLSKNSLWNNEGFDAEAGKGGGLLAVLEATAVALNKHQSAKAEELRQTNKNMFVESVRQSVSVTGVDVINWDTFRITFKYHGYRVLKNITWECYVDDGFILREDTGGPVYPNRSYYVVFQSERLRKYDQAPDQFLVIDAK